MPQIYKSLGKYVLWRKEKIMSGYILIGKIIFRGVHEDSYTFVLTNRMIIKNLVAAGSNWGWEGNKELSTKSRYQDDILDIDTYQFKYEWKELDDLGFFAGLDHA